MGRGGIDYLGQNLSENLYQAIVLSTSAVAWLYGYYEDRFLYTFYGWLAGATLATLLCVPDWGIYNRNPVKWLSSVPPLPRRSGQDDAGTHTATYVTGGIAVLAFLAFMMWYASRSGMFGPKYANMFSIGGGYEY